MTDLDDRIKTFSGMISRFEHSKVHDLIVTSKIEESDFARLKTIAKLYMSKCLDSDAFSIDEGEIFSRFVNSYDSIKNITPNGLIVPKNHTILEYNLLNQCFYDIIKKLNVDDLITSWHVPLNLRVKLSNPIKENMTRDYSTETIHSDSFAGESSHSVTIMVPLFGDTDNNHLEFYAPPEDFDEEWIGPKSSYAEGEEIAQRYTKLDYVGQKGELIISDFSTLHRSHRKPNCGSRISIDTTFALKRSHGGEKKEVIHPWRAEERASTEIVNNLGRDFLFVFPDSVEQHVSNKGGHKHASHLYPISLKKKD